MLLKMQFKVKFNELKISLKIKNKFEKNNKN